MVITSKKASKRSSHHDKNAFKNKRKKNHVTLTVPLPPEVIEGDSNDEGDVDGLEDEDLELLDVSEEQLAFLERLPKRDIDRSVSRTRKKESLLRHGSDTRQFKGSHEESPDQGEDISDDDLRIDSGGDSESHDSDEEGEEWERVRVKRHNKDDGVVKKKLAVLPVKSLDGEMVEADLLEEDVIPLDPNAFSGVTILDDGTKSKEIERKVELEKKRHQEEAKRKRAEEAKKVAEKESPDLAKAEKDQKDKSVRDTVLKQLDTCGSKKERREMAKSIMAKAAQMLLSDPELQLRKQASILLELIADVDTTVSKLAMLSTLAVMKDIIPAYRIRPMHEREQDDVILSKEVKQLWDYEEALLKSYQAYLKILLKGFRDQKSSKSSLAVSITAAKCLASLVITVPHFNFSGDILQVLVPGTCSKQEDVRKACCDAIAKLAKSALGSAESGQAAVEATQLLADLVKRKKCAGMPPSVISCLLDFSFPDIFSGDDLQQALKSRKKKKKKKNKDDVDRAFRESQAVIDKETRRNQQSAVLEAMFEIYFRVLKTLTSSLKGMCSSEQDQACWAPSKFEKRFPLVTPTLDGLAKFSHLISIDYFQDMIATIEELLESPVIPHTLRFRCLLTTSHISKGQGESLNIDRASLYRHLYKAMLLSIYNPLQDDLATFADKEMHESRRQPAPSPEMRDNLQSVTQSPQYLLTKALEEMLLDSQKALDIHRQAAFTKRAAAIALHTPDSGLCLGLLYFIYRMMRRYPKLRSMLEDDDDGAGPSSNYYSSVMSMDSIDKARTSKQQRNRHGSTTGSSHKSERESNYFNEDPSQHTGALYTPLWELSLLAAHHPNPAVREAAKAEAMLNLTAAQAAASGSSSDKFMAILKDLPSSTSPSDIVAHTTTQFGAFYPPPLPTTTAGNHGNRSRQYSSKSTSTNRKGNRKTDEHEKSKPAGSMDDIDATNGHTCTDDHARQEFLDRIACHTPICSL